MDTHPNIARTQAHWDAIAERDFTSVMDDMIDDVVVDHGPGAGPFAGRGVGKTRLIEAGMLFAELFGGTFAQRGRCIYADDRCAIVSVHETGTATDGAVFDNQAIYIARFGPTGKADFVWTVDLDDEAMHAFWAARSALPVG